MTYNIDLSMLFPHLRAIEPGHPDRLTTIRGKCWIGSRSLLAGAGQARMAWPGHPELARSGFSEVYPSKPGSGSRKTVFSRISDQTKRRVFLSLSEDPGNPENSHFSGKSWLRTTQ